MDLGGLKGELEKHREGTSGDSGEISPVWARHLSVTPG